jgi:lipopolysaccharide transport system ATP-binding protein
MSTVIKIENLSKKYIIGHQRQERYTALRDVIMHKLRGVGQRLRHPLSPNKEETSLEEFWALKDINLEIKQSDRIGIIGRNGAGKSTLLKLLSRITEPTTGRININGRVASLLEVGTGFHPELTGRENIFLNGAILGMSRADIKRNFDEIVAFAEVDKFLDTPVKRYSSGMYVRLAFAVAAHLEPEILIVDEVLAVGDVQFQKKCLGKMGDVAKEGRTVLFVSHNMQAVEHLCDRCIILTEGHISFQGETNSAIKQYLMSTESHNKIDGTIDLSRVPRVHKDLEPVIQRAWMEDAQGIRRNSFFMGEHLKLFMEFKRKNPIRSPGFGVGILTSMGMRIFTINNRMAPIPNLGSNVSQGVICFDFPSIPLTPGRYYITLSVGESRVAYVDMLEGVLPLEIEGSDVYGTGVVPVQGQGVVYTQAKLSYSPLNH